MPLSSASAVASTGADTAPRADSDGDGSGPAELVTRPEPGLARGRWEAPAWVLAAVALAAVVAGLVWAGRAVARWRWRSR